MTLRSVQLALIAGVLVIAVIGCNNGETQRVALVNSIGDPRHGKELITGYGCGACHLIPGVHAARGMVGPPLIYMSQRTMIAGELPNTPENLVRWIENPKAVQPNNAMPDLGLTEDQAYDVAAYLYSLPGPGVFTPSGPEGSTWSE